LRVNEIYSGFILKVRNGLKILRLILVFVSVKRSGVILIVKNGLKLLCVILVCVS
jgi:hypothetical protein